MNNVNYFINEAKIEGGKGDDLDPKEVDQKELAVGIAVEVEHKDGDKEAAQDIAMDHLAENPKYYSLAIKSGLVDEGPALKLASEFGWNVPKEDNADIETDIILDVPALEERKIIQTKKMVNSAKVVREATESLFGENGTHRAIADKMFMLFKKECRLKAKDLGVVLGQVNSWKITLRDYDNNKVNTTTKGKKID
jgi:hypothetical protein